MTKIDLVELTKGEVRNLTGHSRGEESRILFNLDELDNSKDAVEVLVPKELDALTTSFFQGMFAKSVQDFGGREVFLKHYQFEASPIILDQVHRGIDRVLTKRGTALI